jgi:hypothetical protein
VSRLRTECRATGPSLEAYLEDRLPRAEAEALRAHLALCGSCRDQAMERDSSLLFLTLADQSKDEFFWASMWRDIQDGLPARSESRRPPVRRHLWAAAAVVLAVGLAASLAPLLWWGGGGGTGPAVENMAALGPPEIATPVEVSLPDDLPPPLVTVDDPDVKQVMQFEASMPIVMLYNPGIDL